MKVDFSDAAAKTVMFPVSALESVGMAVEDVGDVVSEVEPEHPVMSAATPSRAPMSLNELFTNFLPGFQRSRLSP